ncbi:Tripartite tricarboxylate transporter family receptor [compost metagenome]
MGSLNQAINAAASDTLVRDRLKHEGAQAISGTPEDFGQALSAELEMWRGVVQKSGMALD